MYIDKFVNTNSEEEIEAEALNIILEIKPEWSSVHLNRKHYVEGLTNKILGFWNEDENDQILVRVSGEGTEKIIDKNFEIQMIELLYKNGLGPKLYGVFRNGFCCEYIPGSYLTPISIKERKIYVKIASTMAKMHQVKIEDNKSNLFPKIRSTLDLFPKEFTEKQNIRLKENGLTPNYYIDEVNFLENALSIIDSPVVLCHNDLLMKNILLNPISDTIHFIDFEYTFPNNLHFEIGNHFCEHAGTSDVDYSLYPDNEFQRDWIRSYLSFYLDKKEEDILYKEVENARVIVNKFALAAHLLWAVWAVVQANNSQIDFDYFEYSMIRLNEYRKRKEEFLSAKEIE